MLGSISPLGESARGGRWATTAIWYTLGSLIGGAAVGALAGGAGRLLALRYGFTTHSALLVIGGAAAVGVLLDLHPRGISYPTVRRQVNEDWLYRYRRWVYGFGFGVQLGFGVVTIVTTAAIYLLLIIAFLTQSVIGGAVIGAAFGLIRASTLLVVAPVKSTSDLARVDSWLVRHDRIFARTAIGVELVLGIVAIAI